MRAFLSVFAFASLLAAQRAPEKAAYDSNGRIIALLSDSEDVEISSNLVAVLPGGKRHPIQVRREGIGVTRSAGDLAWSGPFQLPDGGRGKFELKSEEDAAGLRYSVQLTAETALEVDAIEFVADLPRKTFLGGRVSVPDQPPLALDKARIADGKSFETGSLRIETAERAVDLAFDQPRSVTLADRWDNFGRSWQLRVALVRSGMDAKAAASLAATFRVTSAPRKLEPVRITVDLTKPRFHFDGFGGNYCWNNSSPVTRYTLDNLKIAWSRSELKARQWDKQRDNPGEEIRADLEVMRRLQRMGVRQVISIWWLPERFYTDPYEKPRSAHFRLIKPDKWDELLDLLASYLLYAKREYSVEPELFSFNEANIGVYVGLTPETHTEAIKRIGAHFRKAGLKTRMLLGDATGPRDTHKFALDAAADPEAMQYVGAVGFHSWGGGTAEQYAAWGDLAEWLGLPLLVTELGVDGAAYYTRSWDSYQYGLREARMTQELLEYARPQGTQYWQFTNDYGLAIAREGKAEPTARFWLMKHFTDLTPQASEAVTVASDQPLVLVSAFRKGESRTVHVLNLGGARAARLEGLPAGEWNVVETAEKSWYRQKPAVRSGGGAIEISLPARALVTLAL